MKRFFSSIIVASLFLGLLSPLQLAQAERTEEQELLRQRRQIIRVLRQEMRNPSKLSQLRIELESIQAAIKTLRIEKNRQRRADRRREIALFRLRNPSSTRSGGTQGRLTLQPVKLPAVSTPPEASPTVTQVEIGKASYYADKFDGRTTASGEVFWNYKMTAAHLKLPFGTRVRVTNTSNGNSIEVVVNDRGPYVDGRIIDLSSSAFAQLDALSRGVIDVRLEVLE